MSKYELIFGQGGTVEKWSRFELEADNREEAIEESIHFAIVTTPVRRTDEPEDQCIVVEVFHKVDMTSPEFRLAWFAHKTRDERLRRENKKQILLIDRPPDNFDEVNKLFEQAYEAAIPGYRAKDVKP